jgi:hypothetical protein
MFKEVYLILLDTVTYRPLSPLAQVAYCQLREVAFDCISNDSSRFFIGDCAFSSRLSLLLSRLLLLLLLLALVDVCLFPSLELRRLVNIGLDHHTIILPVHPHIIIAMPG